MPRPLDETRVIDLTTGPVGGVATMVLADFGAEVVKVERPGGDPMRGLAAAPLWLRGKRSVELDLEREEARASLHRLTDTADVVVESFRPGAAARLGADYETLSRRNPRLVHCSITGWGRHGPLASIPGWDAVVAARCGRMRVFEGQRPRAGPGFAAVPVGSHAAAQGAVQGIVAGLLAREAHGTGTRVETSILQGQLLYDLFQLVAVQLRGGKPPVPVGDMPTLNYHPVMTRDGRWIQLGNLLEHLFFAFLESADLLGELLSEERYQGPPEAWSPEAIEGARDRILTRMRERTAAEWMERFHASGNVAAEPWTSAQEALRHPDLVANGAVVSHEHPRWGRVAQIGPLARLTSTPGRAGGPAPESGVDALEDLVRPSPASPPPSSSSLPPRRRSPHAGNAEPGRPLAGLTVLDLSTIIAGPLGMSILADLGARIIKVEPIGGDPCRALGAAGILASKTNAGKECICLDLKSDAGREVMDDLVRRADALVHNYRPGVPERLGIGWDRLSAVRPGLVWVSANGYGPDGPSAARPATHPIPGAVTGGALLQAGEGMPPKDCESLEELREAARQLMRANEPNPDPNTGVVIASATLLALLAQARHDCGQAVYVDMLTANAYANSDDFLHYDGKPDRPTVDDGLHGLAATYRLYRACDGWVFLAAPTDAAWTAVAGALDRPDLARDPRFATAAARASHDRELAGTLETIFAARPADDWENELAAQGIACVRADGPSMGEFFAAHPQSIENGLAPFVAHAELGKHRRWGPLIHCDGGNDRLGPGVLAGEHTDRLLAELGRSPAEIRSLRAAGAVSSPAFD